MKLHERIAALRRAAGLSQEALADRVGVSRQAIGKWEAGVSLPGLDNLQALAAALNVSCDELLTGSAAQARAPQSDAERIALDSLQTLLDSRDAVRARAGRRRGAALLAGAVCVCAALAAGGLWYGGRLRELSERMDDVSRQVAEIEGGLETRVSAMQSAIEASMREQASILASYDWQYGTPEGAPDGVRAVPLRLMATPKSRGDGMTAVFTLVPGQGDPLTFPARLQDGVFLAEAAVPLEMRFDRFTVSVSFTQEGQTQTQELMWETSFLSNWQTTASLSLSGFRVTVQGAPAGGARTVTIGGEAALSVARGLRENAPAPVSAVVELFVDGASVGRQTLDLAETLAPQKGTGESGEAALLAGEAATFYVCFDEAQYPYPVRSVELTAAVTDESGAVLTVRETVPAP